jgi:hypothetical protein
LHFFWAFCFGHIDAVFALLRALAGHRPREVGAGTRGDKRALPQPRQGGARGGRRRSQDRAGLAAAAGTQPEGRGRGGREAGGGGGGGN